MVTVVCRIPGTSSIPFRVFYTDFSVWELEACDVREHMNSKTANQTPGTQNFIKESFSGLRSCELNCQGHSGLMAPPVMVGWSLCKGPLLLSGGPLLHLRPTHLYFFQIHAMSDVRGQSVLPNMSRICKFVEIAGCPGHREEGSCTRYWKRFEPGLCDGFPGTPSSRTVSGPAHCTVTRPACGPFFPSSTVLCRLGCRCLPKGCLSVCLSICFL